MPPRGDGGYNRSMAFTEEDVGRLADLVRIRLVEEEKSGLVKDLNKILEHFRDLGEVNTENIAPVEGGSLNRNATRADEENLTPDADFALLTNFPQKDGNLLRVPSVFGD